MIVAQPNARVMRALTVLTALAIILSTPAVGQECFQKDGSRHLTCAPVAVETSDGPRAPIAHATMQVGTPQSFDPVVVQLKTRSRGSFNFGGVEQATLKLHDGAIIVPARRKHTKIEYSDYYEQIVLIFDRDALRRMQGQQPRRIVVKGAEIDPAPFVRQYTALTRL